MTLDELRRRRASDLLAVLDRQRPRRIDPGATEPPLAEVELVPCSGRELAWLEAAIALSQRQTTRTIAAPRAPAGIFSPSSPSALSVSSVTRYYLAASDAAVVRDVYVVYSGLSAVLRPAVG